MELNILPESNFFDITDDYKKFATTKIQCTQCSVYEAYKKVVSSDGNAKNPIFMFIGECPGKDEVELNKPFIGRAGQRLRRELRKYSDTFNRKTSIITNLLPCRPLDNKFPSKTSEGLFTRKNNVIKYVTYTKVINSCKESWLDKEIDLLSPKIIVSLGSQSLFYVFGKSGITQNRGKWEFSDKYQSWFFATYHPSYVMRCQNDPDKEHVVKEFEDDIKRISQEWRIMADDPRLKLTKEEWKSKHIDTYVRKLLEVEIDD